ncbi:MAG: Acetoacetate metabolism regulatory protein AtoC [Firmicutes bacterium]|nr:Acetoacetate metabolism regulatory protein AtoC [Bacillota bacterium]
MDNKIIIITPYQKLKDIADEVVKDMGLNIETALGDLRDGVEVARDAKLRGKEIIISRGGTARVIRENVDLPVVEIKVSGYDLLRVLYRHRDDKYRLGSVGYSNVISGVKTIGEILGLDIEYFSIDREEEAVEKIQEAAALGIDLIIGDTISVKTAQKVGLKHDLVESGREALTYAIEEAIKVYELTLRERKEKQQLKAILDFSHEGIIATDREGRITLYNPASEKIFGISHYNVLGKKISEVIPNTRIPEVLKTGQMELGKIQKTDTGLIATNRVPIIIEDQVMGAVATFQDVTKIQELEQKIRQEIFKKGLVARHRFEDIIGNSSGIRRVVELAKKYALTDSTILIYGESGTGKELFAQSIHNASKRKDGPFVAINCAALPSNLLESELFGYEEGAFTGALKGGKKGLFEIAHNGTIFLDEINEMDIGIQARMLRVIQEKEIMRIGGDKVIPVDVRVVAASNRHLRREVELGSFREDLYYRINVLSIEIPPLRKRKEDIAPLLDYFIIKFSRKHNKKMKSFESKIIDTLKNYDWPGNVRELENIIEKLVIISDGKTLQEADAEDILSFELNYPSAIKECPDEFTKGTLDEITKKIVKRVLEEEDYNKTRTADRLGIDRGTLTRKLKK